MAKSKTGIDMRKFRLSTFIDRSIDIGAGEIHGKPVSLTDLSHIFEARHKAVLARQAGPDRVEPQSNVAGGRRHLATAFVASVDPARKKYMKRLDSPQP